MATKRHTIELVASAEQAQEVYDVSNLIVLAHDHYKMGRFKRSLELFALAMSKDGSETLAELLDNFNSSVDNNSQEDDKKPEVKEPEPKKLAEEADLENEDFDDNDDDGEKDDDDSEDSSASRMQESLKEAKESQENPPSRQDALARVLSNKVSLAGTRTQRELGSSILTRQKKAS